MPKKRLTVLLPLAPSAAFAPVRISGGSYYAFDGFSDGIRSRRARHQPIVPVVEIRAEEEQPGWFTLSLIAVNRPYLLANAAEVFNRHGISLRYAQISTTDDRVEDSFLLYSPGLADPNRQVALKKDLSAVLAV